jgi:hypothetical protein
MNKRVKTNTTVNHDDTERIDPPAILGQAEAEQPTLFDDTTATRIAGAPTIPTEPTPPPPPPPQQNRLPAQSRRPVPHIHEDDADEEDRIRPGAGGPARVPEDDDDDDDDDDDEEVEGSGATKIGKPGKHDRVLFNPINWLPTKLIVDKPEKDSMDEVLYYVTKALRKKVRSELKKVIVLPFYSTRLKIFRLWVVKVTTDNSWYQSVQDKLLRQDAAFFEKNEFRIWADKKARGYRVKCRPKRSPDPVWPTLPTLQLLAEALGADHIIDSVNHEFYAELVSGDEVE